MSVVSRRQLPVVEGVPYEFTLLTPEEQLREIQVLRNKAEDTKQQLLHRQNKVAERNLANLAVRTPPVGKLKFKSRAVFKGHAGKIFQMKVTKDSEFLATIGQDGFALVWDAQNKYKCDAISLDQSVAISLGLSPSGRLLAIGGLDNTASIYAVKTDNYSESLLDPTFNRRADSQKRVAGGLRARVPLAIFKGHKGFISNIDFLSDQTAITASGDMTIGAWDVETSTSIKEYAGTDHFGAVTHLEPHPSHPFIFVSASTDFTVKVWDIRERRSQCTFYGQGEEVTALTFFPDGNAIATGCNDCTLRLFDLRNHCQVATFPQTKYCISTSIAFTPSGRCLIVGLEDGTMEVMDVLRGTSVSVMNGHKNLVSSIAASSNGRIYSSSWDGTIRTWMPVR